MIKSVNKCDFFAFVHVHRFTENEYAWNEEPIALRSNSLSWSLDVFVSSSLLSSIHYTTWPTQNNGVNCVRKEGIEERERGSEEKGRREWRIRSTHSEIFTLRPFFMPNRLWNSGNRLLSEQNLSGVPISADQGPFFYWQTPPLNNLLMNNPCPFLYHMPTF